ncbi:MAG: glutathione S-transferase family protein [Gammaproteobacteria bacterium]|nr:glutathione S-transferase family protein [Gammaproteobacteria bacterium]MDH3508484.1 glutathione S-transferase family protein [Gammaproteobacteria bacterium]
MKLYHYSKSRSTRVFWLLEELGLEYDAEMLPFDSRAFGLADHLEIESYGELPILVDAASSMSESIAVVTYLLDRYGEGRLEPDRASNDYGPFLEWIQFGERSLMDPLSQLLQHAVLLPEAERDRAVADRARRVFTHNARSVDEALEGKSYLVGDTFSAADIVIGYALFLADDNGLFPRGLDNLRAYFERLSERPAFKLATAS